MRLMEKIRQNPKIPTEQTHQEGPFKTGSQRKDSPDASEDSPVRRSGLEVGSVSGC